MITSIRGCVAYNDLWPRPISSRSFSNEFTIKLLNMAHLVVSALQLVHLNGFFSYLVQMIISMRGCFTYNDLRTRPISSRPFNHEFAIKLLECGRSCIRSTSCTVLDEFLPYLLQIIANMSGRVARNELWPRPISPRFYSCDVTILWTKFICGTNTTHEGTMYDVPFPGQRSRAHMSFTFVWSGRGYPNRSMIYNF